MAKLSWAFLGTSMISKTVAKSLQKSSGSQLIAVFGRDPDRLAEFQLEFDIPYSSQDPNEVINRSDVDAVYISLPNHLHCHYAKMAVDAGKHVLCEKSLDVTMAAVDDIISSLSASKSTVFFSEALMHLRHPLIVKYWEFLRSDQAAEVLGQVRAIHCHYSCDIQKFANVHGKGAIYNLGCYPVSLLQLTIDALFGEGAFEKRLHSQVVGKRYSHIVSPSHVAHKGGDNVAETICVTMFQCGVLASVQTAETFGKSTVNCGFEVIGTSGKLWFETNPYMPLPNQDNSFKFIQYSQPKKVNAVTEGSLDYDAYYYQFKEVEHAISAGLTQSERPAPRLADSIAIMKYITDWEAAVPKQ
ncbi:hypothetical protein MP228_011727 [Amoeboaphelidium protococcarum]|nr:hypothetical protein MP228_011727 [Amoeboaphelidium protococcarum]